MVLGWLAADFLRLAEVVFVAVAACSSALAARYARQSQVSLQDSKRADLFQRYYEQYTVEPAAREVHSFTEEAVDLFSNAVHELNAAREGEFPVGQLREIASSAIGRFQTRQGRMKDLVIGLAEVSNEELAENLRARAHRLEDELIERLPALEADPMSAPHVGLVRRARVDMLRMLIEYDPGIRGESERRRPLLDRCRAAVREFRD